MNIIFAGTPAFAAKSLEAIIKQGHQVIAVYTQPDRPSGRGKKLAKSDVKLVAEAHNIPAFQPEKLTNEADQAVFSALKPDLMIVAAYGLLLPRVILNVPKYGCINIHASLLPRWRGAAPIQRAIQTGDAETGITIMQMDEGLDTGDMLIKLSTPISESETASNLHDRLADLGADAILEYLREHKNLGAEKQDNSLACYAKKLSKQEAHINWRESGNQIARNVRAFNPVPVAFFELEDMRIRVLGGSFIENNGSEAAGTVLNKDKKGILIKCGEGAYLIEILQFPGSKSMPVQAFINGGKNLLNPGDVLQSPEQEASK
ncbi:MAG: methionyl-tRNA formyltransferase [Oleiphilaceae bacterium]